MKTTLKDVIDAIRNAQDTLDNYEACNDLTGEAEIDRWSRARANLQHAMKGMCSGAITVGGWSLKYTIGSVVTNTVQADDAGISPWSDDTVGVIDGSPPERKGEPGSVTVSYNGIKQVSPDYLGMVWVNADGNLQ